MLPVQIAITTGVFHFLLSLACLCHSCIELAKALDEQFTSHERFTRADRDFEDDLHSYTRDQPRVRHLVYAT